MDIYEDLFEGHAIYPFLSCANFFILCIKLYLEHMFLVPSRIFMHFNVISLAYIQDIHNGFMKTITEGMSLKYYALGHLIPSTWSLE